MLLRDYVLNLKMVLGEVEPEEEGRERRILDETFERTFRSWSEKDWKALEKAFRKRF